MNESQLFYRAHNMATFIQLSTGMSYRAAFSIALSKAHAMRKEAGIICLPRKNRRLTSVSVEVQVGKARMETYTRAIEFGVKRLGLSKKGLKISFVRASSLPKNTLGTCGGGTDFQRIEVRNTRNLNDNLDTIFHELKHAQQLAQGRLEQISGGLRKWEGKLMNNAQIEWSKRPWEKEAIKAGEELLKEFTK